MKNRDKIRRQNAALKRKKPPAMTDEELQAHYHSVMIASRMCEIIGGMLMNVVLDYRFSIEMEIADRKLKQLETEDQNDVPNISDENQGDDGLPDHSEISLQGQGDAVPDE